MRLSLPNFLRRKGILRRTRLKSKSTKLSTTNNDATTPTDSTTSAPSNSNTATSAATSRSATTSSFTAQWKHLTSTLPSLSFPSLSSIPFISSLPSLPSFDLRSKHAYLEKDFTDTVSPYDASVAEVERRDGLCAEEVEYRQRRTRAVLPHLWRLVHPTNSSSTSTDTSLSSLSQPVVSSLSAASSPTVAICLSGGGYRAMLGSLASMKALDELGVLQASTYMAGLSGSTWAMSQVYSRPSSTASPLDLPSILRRVRDHVSLPLLSLPSSAAARDELLAIVRRSIVDKLYHSQQSLTVTDLLGWSLSQRVLASLLPDEVDKDSSATTPSSPAAVRSFLSNLTLSSQREALTNAALPFPLYSAVSSPSQVQFEFSPYSVGSYELSAFIPTWSFNRPFTASRSTSSFPREPHLSTLLSAFSSAHCTDLSNQLREMAYQMRASERVKESVKELVARMTREWKLDAVHPFEAIRFHSFLHQLTSHPPLPSSLTQSDTLALMDAGLAFNYPLVPLLQPCRAVDVVLLIDFTSPPEAMNGSFLKAVQRYCTAHSLPLPHWSDGYQPLATTHIQHDEHIHRAQLQHAEQLSTHTASERAELDALQAACHSRVTVFAGEEGSGVPTVVYVPLLSNVRYDGDFCPRRVFESGGFTSTLNFVYRAAESEKLCGLVEANVRECGEVIRAVIRQKWEEKERRLQLAGGVTGGR